MSTLFLDLETWSDVPITAGTHRYAERAEIMLAAWAVDQGPVIVDDLTTGATPVVFLHRIESADRIAIHNSGFDRTVLRHQGVELPVEKIDDTMVRALAHGLPGSLGKLCEIFKVPTDKAKDARGKQLINLFCKPRPKKQKLRRATRETHPEQWQEFIDYARLDIEAMRVLDRKMPRWNTDLERDLWRLDQAINDRGVAIDMDLVAAAIAAVDKAQAELAEQTQKLTDEKVRAATQRDAVLAWILESFGIQMEDLRASTVEAMLENDNYPPELLDLLRIRLQASTTSTAKYNALARSTSSDGRLRGTLQFCGASRTGRWAGRLFQPQNLPRPTLDNDTIDTGIGALKAGVADLITGNVMELTSSAIRGAIVAPPGRKLVVADLSNIEGRVLAWLADEQWKLDAFAAFDRGEGPDLYKATAGKILGKSPDDVTKLERQQVGKVAELALGYEGGVGAFMTFATAYGIDLDELAQTALGTLPPHVVKESASLWQWMHDKKGKSGLHGLPRETWIGINAIKTAWRQAHWSITTFWNDLATAARVAIDRPGTLAARGHICFVREKAWLRMILPSGRSLCYPSPAVDEHGAISYMGINQYSRKWQRLKTYGGKLAENATQAVARDVLAHGMLTAEANGFEIVLSVHDELITEAPDGDAWAAENLSSAMSNNPPWADGLPLAASGFEAYRYRKD